MQPAEQVNVLGVGVHAVDIDDVVISLQKSIRQQAKGYVCLTGVHGIMEAQREPALKSIFANALLVAPDGMPTVWLGHAHGFKAMTRVYGPDYMLEVCKMSVERGYRHFLYGGKPGVAEQLRATLLERFPGLQIVGIYTPPFRPLNADEEKELHQQVQESGADVLWCGLSTPKQERFMATYNGNLPVKLMVGVGAAFDLLSGNLSEAPGWMKKSGLQWFYRLLKEPRRLWRRYLMNNPRFVWLTMLQLTRFRKFSLS